jgi:hypothetical protein
MRKLILILWVIIVTLGLLNLAAAIREDPEYLEYSKDLSPAEKAKLYKIDIHQKTPSEGIETGHVILYGHYIKPPYKYEIVNDTLLFLNGVRAYPVLQPKVDEYIREKRREKYKEADRIAEPHTKRVRSLIDTAEEVYMEIASTKGRDVAIDSVYEVLKGESLIVEVRIEPKGEEDASMSIWRYTPGFRMPPKKPMLERVSLRARPREKDRSLELLYPPPKNEAERIARKRKFLEKWTGHYENYLRKGRALFHSTPRSPTEVEEINKIMRDARLSPDDKLEALSKIGRSTKWTKKIFYNFDPKEYPELKEEEE